MTNLTTTYQRAEALHDQIRQARETWYAISCDPLDDGDATSELHERYEDALQRIDNLQVAIEQSGDNALHALTRVLR